MAKNDGFVRVSFGIGPAIFTPILAGIGFCRMKGERNPTTSPLKQTVLFSSHFRYFF